LSNISNMSLKVYLDTASFFFCRFFQSTLFSVSVFPFDIISSRLFFFRHYVLSTFFPFRRFVPFDCFSLLPFVPVGVFSIRPYVLFGVFSFDVLSVDVFVFSLGVFYFDILSVNRFTLCTFRARKDDFVPLSKNK
jgi:hypothetical protein